MRVVFNKNTNLLKLNIPTVLKVLKTCDKPIHWLHAGKGT